MTVEGDRSGIIRKYRLIENPLPLFFTITRVESKEVREAKEYE